MMLTAGEHCSTKMTLKAMNEITLFVVLVLRQPEVSISIATTAGDSDIPVEVTGCHMQPVVVLETLNLSRYANETLYQ